MLLTLWILLVIILILSYLFINKTIEKYAPYPYSLHSYFLKPIWQIWNMPTRSTRNISYDIRGDPFPIPQSQSVKARASLIPNYYVSPWLNSPLFPIQNKPLWMVS